VEWINLADGREKWLAVVDVVMNIRAPHSPGGFTDCPRNYK